MRYTGMLLGCLICSVLLLSCSSAPEQPKEKTEKKNRAAEYSKAGNSYFNEGRYTQALQFFRLALNDNISVDNETGIVGSYNSIGKVYLAAGYPEEAEQNFRKALAQAEKIPDPILVAQSKTNLAEVYLERDDVEQAARFLDEAVRNVEGNTGGEASSEGAEHDLAIIYHNIGSVYKKRGDLDSAYQYFQKALRINSEREQFEEMASNYYMIASLHSKRGDYAAARQNIDLALSYDKRVENSIGIAKDWFAKGMIEEKAGDDELAYESYEKSFLVYQALYMKRSAANVLPYLIPLAERLGKEQEAQYYRELAKQLQGS